jgi:hypothetical protein
VGAATVVVVVVAVVGVVAGGGCDPVVEVCGDESAADDLGEDPLRLVNAVVVGDPATALFVCPVRCAWPAVAEGDAEPQPAEEATMIAANARSQPWHAVTRADVRRQSVRGGRRVVPLACRRT